MAEWAEFKAGWAQRVALPLLFLAMPGQQFVWVVFAGHLKIFYPTIVLALVAAGLYIWSISRKRLLLTPEKITYYPRGRFWPGPREVLWTDIGWISWRKGVVGNGPVLHLKDGTESEVWLPARAIKKRHDTMAVLSLWRARGTGDGEQLIQIERGKKHTLREGLLLLVAVLTPVLLVWALLAGPLSLAQPVDVPACPLVPDALLQTVVPGAQADGAGENCAWQKKESSPRLLLSVYPAARGHLFDAVSIDRDRDERDHVVHRVKGDGAYSWSSLDDRTAHAVAKASPEGYRVRVALLYSSADQSTAERQVTDILHAVVAELENR